MKKTNLHIDPKAHDEKLQLLSYKQFLHKNILNCLSPLMKLDGIQSFKFI